MLGLRPQPAGRIVLTVGSEANGLRVDRYLREQTKLSPPLLFKLLRKKSIIQVSTAQTKRLQGSDRVHAGMQIQIPGSLLPSDSTAQQQQRQQQQQQQQHFSGHRLQYLYESSSLVVIQKPYGLACQGGTGVTSSIDMMLPQEHRLVHRLDRHTTGALVVARTRLAASALARAFSDRQVDKTYIALLSGVPKERAGTINHALISSGESVRLSDGAEDDRAKEAITRYRVLKTGAWRERQISLVELDILTGRKHQIRVHCAKVLGCPVLGDSRYSAAASEKTKDHMFLHLFRIKVPNIDEQGCCTSGERPVLSVTAPFPLYWQQAFSSLGIKFSINSK